jgi:hypothetical protein
MDITTLLSKKYDITIEEYFSLPEKSKNEITNIIMVNYNEVLTSDFTLIYLYIDSIEEMIIGSRRDEEYEKCDILIRLKNKLIRRIETIEELV